MDLSLLLSGINRKSTLNQEELTYTDGHLEQCLLFNIKKRLGNN